MNRIVALVALFFTAFCPLAAAPVTNDLPPPGGLPSPQRSSLAYLDNLIEASQQTVDNATALRQEIQGYLALQEQFVANTESRDLCYRMVKEASLLLRKIEEAHLIQALDPEFLNELTFFAQMGSKRGVPQPS